MGDTIGSGYSYTSSQPSTPSVQNAAVIIINSFPPEISTIIKTVDNGIFAVEHYLVNKDHQWKVIAHGLANENDRDANEAAREAHMKASDGYRNINLELGKLIAIEEAEIEYKQQRVASMKSHMEQPETHLHKMSVIRQGEMLIKFKGQGIVDHDILYNNVVLQEVLQVCCCCVVCCYFFISFVSNNYLIFACSFARFPSFHSR